MKEPKTIFLDTSPHGNLEAFVEQDTRVAFFYLRATEDEAFGLKSCWIRNLSTAPEELDLDIMEQGASPMLPRMFCTHPRGQGPLDKEGLRVTWFPEGDGAALMQGGEFLAVIPPWSGINGFHGYARDCVGESTLCWKLKEAEEMERRIREAHKYWASWESKESPWSGCKPVYLHEYERVLGRHSQYFAIDGNKWPPKAVVRFDLSHCVVLLTLGVSLRPQPQVEMFFENPSDYRRIELGACFANDITDDTVISFVKYLSSQSSLPWRRFTFLGNGHTLGCDVLSSDRSLSIFSSLLLLERPRGGPDFRIPKIEGDKVNVLWCIPLTKKERRLVEERGSKQLARRFPEGQPSWRMEKRREVT